MVAEAVTKGEAEVVAVAVVVEAVAAVTVVEWAGA